MVFKEFMQGVLSAMVNHWQTMLISSTLLLVLYSLASSRSMKTWYGDIRGPKPFPVLGHFFCERSFSSPCCDLRVFNLLLFVKHILLLIFIALHDGIERYANINSPSDRTSKRAIL